MTHHPHPRKPLPRRYTALHLLLVTWLTALAMLGRATAQETSRPSPEPSSKTQAIHPGVLLGRRAGAQLAKRQVLPIVVLVPEPYSYAKAIATWTPDTFFPVLIDDGSWTAQKNISRFVRRFKPAQVVRWTATDVPGAATKMRPHRSIPNAKSLANETMRSIWKLESDAARTQPTQMLISRWIETRHDPLGIIAADTRDPGWTAALALAAGRGEPIMWTEFAKLAVNSSLSKIQAAQLESHIEDFCTDQIKLPWSAPGDMIDAITVCGSLPARVQTGEGEFVATTDWLGRSPSNQRWSWAGQIFGSEPQAAYLAMCSLFLEFHSAWIFDTYTNTEPWVQWDGTRASEVLKKQDWLVMLNDEPHNTLGDWKLRTERPVHADLILINSSGNRSWFQVGAQRGRAGDIPLLEVPSVMMMVHSWSAVAPQRHTTIAGRWFERGVYAYIGSVHEPYLQAFVPTPIFTQRLMAGMALGAAGRLDSGPVWRIAVLGDPLIAYRPKSVRTDDPLPLDDAKSVQKAMQEAARAGHYAQAVQALALLGRDSDAAKLILALRKDKPEAFDAALARAGLCVLFRTGQDDAFIRAYSLLEPNDAADPQAVDALWHVGRRLVREGGNGRKSVLGLMAAHMREDQKEEDAAELRQLGVGRPSE